MSDRIKLAEAMGWRRINDEDMAWWPAPYIVERIKNEYPDVLAIDYIRLDGLPDPENDANDDYAVLEWARNNWLTRDPPHPDQPEWNKFCDALWEIPTLFGSLLFYKVGDYARAALKVIDE